MGSVSDRQRSGCPLSTTSKENRILTWQLTIGEQRQDICREILKILQVHLTYQGQ